MKNEEDSRSFTSWVKDHKKTLIFSGVSLALIAVGIGVLKTRRGTKVSVSIPLSPKINPNDISRNIIIQKVNISPDSVANEVSDVISNGKTAHYVSSHVRTLKEGWSASAQKIATAADHGYTLLSNQTWVEAYNTRGIAL